MKMTFQMVLFYKKMKIRNQIKIKKLSIFNTDHKGPIENELLIVEMTNNKNENDDESEDEEDEM